MSVFSFLFFSCVCSITLHYVEECEGLAFTWQKQDLRNYAAEGYNKNTQQTHFFGRGIVIMLINTRLSMSNAKAPRDL